MPTEWTEPAIDLMPFFRWAQDHGRFIYAGLVGGLGLMVGSFLNVAIYRWPRGLNLMHPPSACPACGHPIRSRDNIPVLGWLRLRGRCRDCANPISPRYPLVEALHGACWAGAAWWGYPLAHGNAVNAGIMLTFLVFISLLLVATFIDFDVQLIPDEVSLGGAAFVFAATLVWPERMLEGRAVSEYWFPALGPRMEAARLSLLGMAAGAGVIYFFTVLGTLAFRRRIRQLKENDPDLDTAIGFGDIKLMLLIGAYLGVGLTMASLVWCVYVGGVVAVVLRFVSGQWPDDAPRWSGRAMAARWNSGAAVMALGPYLALGALIMAFGGDRMTAWMWSWVLPAA